MVAGRFVGQSVLRREDPRLVSGHGRYVDDVRVPGMVHAAFVRSHVARARIAALDVAAAERLPGVRAVYTARDLEPLIVGPLGATMYLSAPIPSPVALASGDVRYPGQPVALVLADSRYLAEDACELVRLDYDVATPVMDMETAAESEILVHPERGSNVVSQSRRWDDDLELAIRGAPYVVTRTFRQPRQSHTPMEPHGVVASWDRFDGELRIWCTSQRVHEVRATMGRVTGIPEQRIHVVQRDVGGAFGQKGAMRPEEIAVVLAACKAGVAVKWVEDRHENLVAGGHARSDRIAVTMGLDHEGGIIGAELDYLEDAGAYPSLGSVGGLVAMMFPGAYRMGGVNWSTRAVFTNSCGRAPYRGPWNIESLAREQIMDAAAREMGLDPVELRRRNVIARTDMPFTNASGMTYADIDPAAVLAETLRRFDYPEFLEEQSEQRGGGRRIGVGVSLFVEPTALGTGTMLGTEAAHVKVSLAGKVTVALGTSSHGQSIATTMAQIAADELGVDIEDVSVVDGETDITPIGGGTGGSRSGVIGGGATHRAAGHVRDKVLRVAAELMEAAPEDLETDRGRIQVRGTPTRSVSLAQVAHAAYVDTKLLPAGVEPGLEALVRYSTPAITFANACHICVVEILPSGQVEILRYVVVEDCGAMINPMVVHGQISGGVVQGIGGALYERFCYDEDGNPLTTTFMDYLIPTSTEVPFIEISHLNSPARGPGGYKGVGEGGAIGAVPAVRNAISDALGADVTDGVRPCDLFESTPLAGGSSR